WREPARPKKELSMSRSACSRRPVRDYACSRRRFRDYAWAVLPGLALLAPVAAAGEASLPAAAPTFTRDVAPILNSRCVACHRAGEIGPMALTSYKEVRPYAKAIRDVVSDGKMPPWHADPHYGKFANDRRLSEAEVRTLLQWVNGGSPEGDPKDLPPAPK